MLGSSFLRLWCRPAFLAILPMAALAIIFLLVMLTSFDMSMAGQVDLGLLVAPLVLGVLVGQTVQDLRYRFFSWTLPGLERKLAVGAIGIGVASGLFWVWAYRVRGGTVEIPEAISLYLLVFAACGAARRTIGLVLVTLLAAAVWSEPLFAVLRAAPQLCTALALVGAVVCFYGFLSRSASRRLLLGQHQIMLVNSLNVAELERAAERKFDRKSRSRAWRIASVGTDLWAWVRAVEFGSFAMIGPGQGLLRRTGYFAFMGFFLLQPAFMGGVSFEEGVERAFQVLFTPSESLEDAIFVPVGFFLGAWAWGLVASSTALLQPGWLYPMSRLFRSRLVFRLSLLQNLRIVFWLTLTFAVFGGLVAYLRGGLDKLHGIPDYLLGALVVVVLVPAAQWIGTWERRTVHESALKGFVWLAMFPFAGLVMGLIYLLQLLLGERPVLQVVLLIGLAMGTQWLYHRALVHHYRRADLM